MKNYEKWKIDGPQVKVIKTSSARRSIAKNQLKQRPSGVTPRLFQGCGGSHGDSLWPVGCDPSVPGALCQDSTRIATPRPIPFDQWSIRHNWQHFHDLAASR